MIWLFNTILLLYLAVSNIAIVFRIYKSFLQYMTPVKGYLTIAVLFASLGGIDYYVYEVTTEKFVVVEETKKVFQQIEERGLELQQFANQK
ncbi:hypothetical protein [Flammeovirga kamogawensis]|uniref:Uncharacterized protein n=1 Tax=Flammeovirga kamogawensis TaxID=373891 RepID=A0ABX8GZQ1_9BACT|nr:hypothetical protein [Flammeovirga kamogawensis]MBB6462794.1 hypothetical protein [Flammeovirga kamogawensis]QWG08420.1 hypothetical protein KM029_05655 [Flammeovirga kamogawensis]TRX66716.1 hypothetical protein EO216_00710 [Flammeovirga kamogawensis]